MERAMSVEERIRRAEEIYNKRNGQYNIAEHKMKNNGNNNVKKMIMQIFVCLSIYLAFYIFTNSEYIFSKEFLNQIKGNFNQDSKIYSIYLNAKSYIEDKLSTNNEQIIENTENTENKDVVIEESSNGIGGAESNIIISDEEVQKSSQENESNKPKKKVSFIMPVKGRISSGFGWRTPETKTVPKYHTGIDIAAKSGTVIKSATDGKVILVSEEGDYGKHYKIKTDEYILIYAHCKKLYLKQGDKVKQGDKIAEVGSTGNSTGPHLHFEVRKGDELIDPSLILNL